MRSPLLQPIDPEGHVFRLHLSPLKRSKLDKDKTIKLLTSQKLLKRGEDYAFWLKEIMTEVIRKHFKIIDAEIIDDLFSRKRVFRHSKSYGYTFYRVINDIEAKEFHFLKRHIEQL